MKGYTGISFPFRVGNKGGVAMSTTTFLDPQHIQESIIQILKTRIGERVQEPEFGSNIDTFLFSPTDIASANLIAFEVVQALEKWEPRIRITMDDIDVYLDDTNVVIGIEYEIIDYGIRVSLEIPMGGVVQ